LNAEKEIISNTSNNKDSKSGNIHEIEIE